MCMWKAPAGHLGRLAALLSPVLLAGAAIVVRLAQVCRRRRRAPSEKATVVFADHDRLVVTCSRSAGGDTICVLRPAGEDPTAILRAARLVLPEDAYRELAHQLSVVGDWLTG